MNDILKKYNINQNEKIVVGVSAGPDSMCLLSMLKEETDNIICAHINHNIRKQSKKEEEYLKKYCINKNIIFETLKIKKYTSNNFENEAREKRYEFYKKILKKYNSKYLFLAHHGDDLIETVLMKIVRGSNIEGYAGIKEISKIENYYIIRPLLKYTKEDLINYNKKHNITYFIDKSNKNIKYTRNRYRKYILPFLKKEDKNVHLKFINYSNTLLEYENYIKQEAIKNSKLICKNNIIDLNKLNNYDSFMKKNILFYILNNYYDNKINIVKERHIKAIIDLIDNKKPNLTLTLPYKLIIKKEYEKLFLTNINITNTNYKIKFNNEFTIDNFIIKQIDFADEDNNYICRLNSNSITLPLYFRNRKNGDFIELKGKNGKSKIKDIFIDNKIPTSKRNTYPLLTDANDNILWIPGIKKSKFIVKKGEKCDIILKCRKEEEDNE